MANHANNRGIRDWELKKTALEILFEAWTDEELARAVLGVDSHTEFVGNLAGSFKSWREGKSSPTGSTGRSFLTALQNRLAEKGSTAGNIKAVIVSGCYKDFYQIIPEVCRVGIPEPENVETTTIQHAPKNHDVYYPMLIARDASSQTAKSALNNGRIDQKFHYLSPDSAEIWQAVVNAGQYHQYEECKTSLDVLCKGGDKGREWHKFFKENGGCSVIILGCGAPSKDLLIIKSILSLMPDTDTLKYVLVDYSYYMLESSFCMIDNWLARHNLRSRVDLLPIRCDFLKLIETEKVLRQGNKNVAWIIPGGTIGNLNERQFFDSVGRESMSGDLLIIGAETIGAGNIDNRKECLKEKYDIPEIRSFVETALRAVWHDLKRKESLQDALHRIAVEIAGGEQSGHSVVKGSITVEVSLPIDKGKIVLLTSTRYNEENFVDFAEKKGFKCEAVVESPLNKQYKQFVFRCSPSA